MKSYTYIVEMSNIRQYGKHTVLTLPRVVKSTDVGVILDLNPTSVTYLAV